MRVRSELLGAVFPGLPGPEHSRLLAIQLQLDESERWPLERLRSAQLLQLRQLVAHAMRHAPAFRSRAQAAGLHADFELQDFQRVPVQQEDCSEACPPVGDLDPAALFEQAVLVRRASWFRWPEPSRRCRIGQEGSAEPLPLYGEARTCPEQAPRRQARWLRMQGATSLEVTPVALDALVQAQVRMPSELSEVVVVGAPLEPERVDAAAAVLGVPVRQVWWHPLAGSYAVECPEGGHHVQMERVLVELVHGSGAAPPSGAPGAVVLTPLHAFRRPMFRLAAGVHARPGGSCSCGRGLFTLARA